MGFSGVYIIFLIFYQNIECGYTLEPSHRGGSNEHPQSMFETKIKKILLISIPGLTTDGIILHRRVILVPHSMDMFDGR